MRLVNTSLYNIINHSDEANKINSITQCTQIALLILLSAQLSVELKYQKRNHIDAK